ncbi:MAG TPA: hypothetical protein VEG39_14700 [Clostridia bacterium]|nr:hypothetical protein [Clostridia bacterium]
MKYESYMNMLKSKFERHFHIKTDVEILENKIDMLAKYVNISGRTFLTQNDVIDRCENFEYCYIKKYDTISEEEAAAYGQYLKRIADELIEPGRDHMSTYVTGVIISSNINDSVKKIVERYSYSKVYSFYLKGWCDVRLICIDLDNNEVVTNKAGKKVKKVYQLTA